MAYGNPVFNKIVKVRAFSGESMTVGGTVRRTIILFSLLLASGLWCYFTAGASSIWFMVAGLTVGTILGFVTIFFPKVSPLTAPFYAVSEGFVLGSLSFFSDTHYPGAASQALMLSGGVLATMLFLHSSRVLRVTDKAIVGVLAAMLVLLTFYMVVGISGMFGIHVPIYEGHGAWSLAISVAVVCLAAFNFSIDFHQIEEGVSNGSPKFMEWYGAFGLTVTLVWLYVEILRLVQKLKD